MNQDIYWSNYVSNNSFEFWLSAPFWSTASFAKSTEALNSFKLIPICNPEAPYSKLFVSIVVIWEILTVVMSFFKRHTWRTTWATKTVCWRSGSFCVPTRQSLAALLWLRARWTPKRTAFTTRCPVSPSNSFRLSHCHVHAFQKYFLCWFS